jgi:hypothetical protein
MKTLILVLALAGLAFALDVGVDTILAPSGTIDSGQTIIPRIVISNMSSEPADSVSAYFTIDDGTPGGYEDSITGLHIEMLTTETLAFTGWVPRARDSMTVIARTECGGDTFPANDTCRQRFLVRVKDIAVTEIISPAPDTTLDSGVVIGLQARIWNYGNVSLNFDVRFRIYRLDSVVVFESVRNLDLIAGGSMIVTSPGTWVSAPGVYVAEVYAIVPGDAHPENNVARDTFTVRGVITRDAYAGHLYLEGPWPIHVGDTVVPGMGIGYYSLEPDSLWAYIEFRLLGGARVYYESLHVFFPDTTGIYWFPAVVFQVPGLYEGADSVYLLGDQNSINDVYRMRFEVLPEVGVEEMANGEGRMANSGASVVRRLPAGAVVFDAMGRSVVSPKPGVYFVRAEPPAVGREPSAVTVRKVIIQR